MPQAALPQSTQPLLDRLTMATLVAGPVEHAQAAQIGVGPRSGGDSVAMEFADYFEILSTLSEPQLQTTRQNMPQIPALAGSPREEAKQAVPEVNPGSEEASETVELPANASDGQSPDEAGPLLQTPNDALRNGPPKPLVQITQETEFISDSVVSLVSDGENPEDAPPLDRSDALPRSFVSPQPEVSVRSAMPFVNNGTGKATASKGAVGDIFSVIQQQIRHPHNSTGSGVIPSEEVAQTNGAHSPEATLSAPAPRIFPDDLSGMMPQSPTASDAHLQTAGPERTDMGSIDRSSADPTLQENSPVALPPRGYDSSSVLYQAKTRRPASETAQTNAPRTAVDQFSEAITAPPPDRMVKPPAANLAEFVPVRVNAIQPEPRVRYDAQTTLPQQIVRPSGLGLPTVNDVVPEPSRAAVTVDRETFAEPAAGTIAEPLSPKPGSMVAAPANFMSTTEGDTFRSAVVRPEPAARTRFEQFHPEQFSPDVAEITLKAGVDHRAMSQPERAVLHHVQPELQNGDSAEEKLRKLTVYDAWANAPSEQSPPLRTAAFAASAYPATLLPNNLPAPEKSAPKYLSDNALMAEFSVASQPVENQQNVMRSGAGPSSELIRQVFQNTLLPSNRIKEGPIEIRLNPQELGHVRINISVAEGAIAMSIHAERSETLELLRRNIEQLSQEFRQIGYGNISFSFGQNARQNEGRHKDMSINRASANAGTDIPQDLPVRPDVRGPGVDLRV